MNDVHSFIWLIAIDTSSARVRTTYSNVVTSLQINVTMTLSIDWLKFINSIIFFFHVDFIILTILICINQSSMLLTLFIQSSQSLTYEHFIINHWSFWFSHETVKVVCRQFWSIHSILMFVIWLWSRIAVFYCNIIQFSHHLNVNFCVFEQSSSLSSQKILTAFRKL